RRRRAGVARVDPDRDWQRGRSGAGGGEGAGRRGRAHAAGVDAVRGAVRSAAARVSRPGAAAAGERAPGGGGGSELELVEMGGQRGRGAWGGSFRRVGAG